MNAPRFPIEMIEWTCVRCRARQWMTREADLVLRQSSQNFFCLFGHQQHYPEGETEAEKLQKALDAERRGRQRAEQRIAEALDYAEHERRRANGYKGQAVKLAKRAQGGACPCCNRNFVQLARHMATKHPGFSADVAKGEVDAQPETNAPLVH